MAKKRLGEKRDFVDSAFDVEPTAPVVVEDPMDAILNQGADMEGVMQIEKKETDIAVMLTAPKNKVSKDGWLLDLTMDDVRGFESEGVLIGFDIQDNGLYSVKVK